MKKIIEIVEAEVTTGLEVPTTTQSAPTDSDGNPASVDNELLMAEYTETRLTDDAVETLNGWVGDEFLRSCDRETVTTYLDTLLLLLIVVRGRASGKELRQDLRRVFGADLSSGTVYPKLNELEDDGKLVSHELKRRKVYTVTDDKTVSEYINRRVNRVATFSLVLKGLLMDSHIDTSRPQSVEQDEEEQ
jgi:hypothetical protein